MRIEIAKPAFSQQTASPFSLTFFVSKESYKETASLLKKDYHLLPSLKSFFKGDGFANVSFCKVEMENVMIAFAIINIFYVLIPLVVSYHLRSTLFEAVQSVIAQARVLFNSVCLFCYFLGQAKK